MRSQHVSSEGDYNMRVQRRQSASSLNIDKEKTMFRTKNFEEKSMLSEMPTLSLDEIDQVAGGSASGFTKSVEVGIIVGRTFMELL
jgi:hypothetical protein